jgi:dUTP pyrophosphatase
MNDKPLERMTMTPINVEIRKVNPLTKLPKQSNPVDAGFDLCSVEDVWIMPGQRKMIDTGIQLSIPPGYFGRICPRSGLAWKSGIHTMAGIIDSGYLGNIKVILINLSDGGVEESFKVSVGDRIAQLILEKCHSIKFIEVDSFEKTSRGESGFGSSGVA